MYTLTIDRRAIAKMVDKEAELCHAGINLDPIVMTDEVKEAFFKKLHTHFYDAVIRNIINHSLYTFMNNDLNYDNLFYLINEKYQSDLHYEIGKNTINMYYLTVPFLEIYFPENEKEYTKKQFEKIIEDLWNVYGDEVVVLIKKNTEIHRLNRENLALQKEITKLRVQLVHEGLAKATMHPNKIAKLLENDVEDTDLDSKI